MYNNLFWKHLSKDKNKLEIFKKGLKTGQIQPFDINVLSRLRRLYYSCYSALIYLYGEETNFETIGNKIELLSLVFEKEDYTIVHADTDSTREIPFYLYKHKHLDNNSYMEVKRGNKTYVYDTFSMLRFAKEIYEQLEHPKILRKVSKKKILSRPARLCDRKSYDSPHDDWLAIGMIPHLEKNLKNSPYKNILKKELLRYKEELDYESILQNWWKEESKIFGKAKRK